jgi:hypothetical protein
LAAVTSPGAYWTVHCDAAGMDPGEASRERAKETEPP